MTTRPNEDPIENLLDQEFDIDEAMSVLVSDLTYVRVGNIREIVGYSAGKHQDAALVQRAFATVKQPLETVNIFHTDRGSEFKNVGIDELLNKHNIERSLSDKGNPYDNAVSETTFKILKTELINDMHFDTLEQLSLELFDYVHWYNNIRPHSTLGYLSPVTYRNLALKKIV